MSAPIVDVVIPIYNAESTVTDSIRSIQSQTLRGIRLVLIDDGSTDNTPEILDRLAASDSRIMLLKQRNSGIVDALNRGWRACDAPLIARHDADDLAAPDRFEKQVAILDRLPGVIALSGAFRHIDGSGKVIGDAVHLPPLEVADPTWIPAREPYLMHPFLMLRRTALEAVGGYRYVFHAEDADLYWRLQEIGQLHNMPDILGDYRISTNSVSSKSIINGRIQALSSQLAAISASRRRAGAPDIVFAKRALKQYQEAMTLDKMVRVAGDQLTGSEQRHLSVATADKLKALSTYRPYELETTDCTFIAQTHRHLNASASIVNRREVSSRLSGAAAQLLLKGKIRNAVALCPPALYLPTAVRALAQLVMPDIMWQKLRRTRLQT